jgi:hypothetical protein
MRTHPPWRRLDHEQTSSLRPRTLGIPAESALNEARESAKHPAQRGMDGATKRSGCAADPGATGVGDGPAAGAVPHREGGGSRDVQPTR